MKKPAAPDAAGFDHGRLGKRRPAIRPGTVRLRPPLDDAGGVAGAAIRRRVSLAHSLPQGTSAWRNLITLFSTVNKLPPESTRETDVHHVDMPPRRPATPIESASTRAMAYPPMALQASTGAARRQFPMPSRVVGPEWRGDFLSSMSECREREVQSASDRSLDGVSRVAQDDLREKCASLRAPDRYRQRLLDRPKKIRDVAGAGWGRRACACRQCVSSSSSA